MVTSYLLNHIHKRIFYLVRQEDLRETAPLVDSVNSIDSTFSARLLPPDSIPSSLNPSRRREEPNVLDLSTPFLVAQGDTRGAAGQDTRGSDLPVGITQASAPSDRGVSGPGVRGPSGRTELFDEVWDLVDRVGERPAQPQPPREVSHTLNHRGQTITLRTSNGVSSYYRDESGEWDSRNGETWVRRNSNDRDIWHGQITRDADGNFVQRGTSSGVTMTMRSDGSITRRIQTAAGQEISLTEQANGNREFVRDRTWTSTDGRSWSTAGSTWQGSLEINNRGEVIRTDQAGRAETNFRSRESAEVASEMQRIGRTYNVEFGTAGQTYSYQYKDPSDDQYRRVNTTLRLPSMNELRELESSLRRYSHQDFAGMRFNFISGSGEGRRVSEWGWYHSELDGRPQIYFGPRTSVASNGWEAFQGTALHEIAHHLQARRWSDSSGRTPPRDIMSFYGFEMNGSNYNRLRDQAGDLWESESVRVQATDGTHSYQLRWYPVVGGTVVREAGRARTNRQMYDNIAAERRPCTQYFTNAGEAHAEALAMLLQNPRLLWDRNQNLYRATRQWDQADINARHGFQVDGRGQQIRDARSQPIPRMIRGQDGNIVENNEANRNRVREMENGWRAVPAPTTQSMRTNINWDEQLLRGNCPCCNV
ncbi:MAG: hypothetical protein K2Z81_19730 [Cyanobacteria bacterium]|nr:hypothetical protein [Cyanobacteriota bacterium]